MVVHSFSCQSASERWMRVFNISVPDKPLKNIELVRYARLLKIPDFRSVFMRETLPQYPLNVECGIVNFNTSNQMAATGCVINGTRTN